MKKSSLKYSAGLSRFLFYFGNIVIGIIFVSPLIWMISASLKPEAEIFANMNSIRTFFPSHASLANYIEVFNRMNLLRVFRNTLLYIALILLLDLLLNSMCGYALAKFSFIGKGAILNLVVALMVLPMEAIMLPSRAVPVVGIVAPAVLAVIAMEAILTVHLAPMFHPMCSRTIPLSRIRRRCKM